VLVSISPASDIVLDVARAADPARSAAATVRLARLAEAEPVSATDFTAIVDAKRLEPIASDSRSAPLRDDGMRAKQRSEARTEAVKGLEQLVLQKLVESMLPKETSTLFGHGTA
jgi:flagellar protein FlgJ